MKKEVHIIPHTHWDKEWYFTASRSKVYLMRHVQEVMKLLIDNPDYPSYLLDGQTSLIEDYVKYYPQDEAVISELIRSKRLFVGPWYTQTDQLIVSAESIVRNLYYGIKGAEKYGHSMKIAYCPDVFGQGGNMPQIYNHFALDGYVFWRGIADDRLKQLEFLWEGSDGSAILSNQLYFAYYYGLNMPKDKEILADYIQSVITPLEDRAVSESLYFPSGGDQAPVQHDLVDVVSQMNQVDQTRRYLISNPEAFFTSLNLNQEVLPTIKGEMIEGKNSRIHKSIYSTRADLKQKNNRIENKLTNILEPLLAISHSLGHRYPHSEIEEIWKLMFENAAHDSIGGCNSDETNQDINARYKVAEDLVDNLLDLHMREVSMSITQDEKYAITVFNTLPYQVSKIIDTKLYVPNCPFKIVDEEGSEMVYTLLEKEDHTDYLLNQFAYLTPHLYKKEMAEQYIPDEALHTQIQIEVSDVPAMGYKQLYLLPDEQPQKVTENKVIEAASKIENDYYQIVFDEKAKRFTVLDKVGNREYQNQFVLVENGDDGDSYNYSPPRQDLIIKSDSAAENGKITIEQNGLTQRLTYEFDLMVPGDLDKRAKGIKDTVFPIKQIIELRKNEKLVRLIVTCENQAKSHRLCLACDSAIYADFSIADRLFGVEKVELEHPSSSSWEKEGWTEAPIAINPMQSFIAVTDENRTVALMTQGVREYELVGSHFETIQLTLFRSFGWMGKEDLVYRPGRASGEKIVPTPDAQLLGPLTFELASIYENDTFDAVNIAKVSKEYLTPLQQYPLADFLNGRTIFKKNPMTKKQPTSYSLLDFAEIPVILSTIKKAEIGGNLVYRIYNPFLSKEITLDPLLSSKDVPVLLDEMTQVATITKLGHNQFQTFVRKV